MVQLNWTVCAQPVDHFQVERSTDNQHFDAVATVAGKAGRQRTGSLQRC